MRISDWSSDVCSSDLGWNVEERRSFSVAGHVEEVVLPFIETLGEKPALVGYCLGGTMAMAAAALRDAMSVTTIAAPWRFSGFPDRKRVVSGKSGHVRVVPGGGRHLKKKRKKHK